MEAWKARPGSLDGTQERRAEQQGSSLRGQQIFKHGSRVPGTLEPSWVQCNNLQKSSDTGVLDSGRLFILHRGLWEPGRPECLVQCCGIPSRGV